MSFFILPPPWAGLSPDLPILFGAHRVIRCGSTADAGIEKIMDTITLH
jgi:hypothetical protein